METSAVMLYLLKEFDQKDTFRFKDELEQASAFRTTNRRSAELVWKASSPEESMQIRRDNLLHSRPNTFTVAIDRFKRLYVSSVALELQLSGKYTGEE
ncbi:hypothetical protein BDZ45DRAFT_806861 [Acephala macrosclerotiorum]|nr:hypothetical protein BDZ45DRAFT_806861 [Acephala macrosclerotiorum]